MCVCRPSENRRSLNLTGWFKLTAPNFLSTQCPRRVLEIEPEIWHTCSVNPSQPVTVFFSPTTFVLFTCVLGDKKFPPEKNTKTSTAWQGLILIGCVQTIRISKKWREHLYLAFCAVKVQKIKRCLGITFSIQSSVGVKCDLIYFEEGPTQSDLRIFARNVLQPCLGVPATGLFRQQNEKRFSFGNY